jgi:hypothetical protein
MIVNLLLEGTWRRGSESNRRIKVLQTSPLPLGYRAPAQFTSVPKISRSTSNLAIKFWSGRRESNPRLRPWQGRTLPLSYSRSTSKLYRIPTFARLRLCMRRATLWCLDLGLGHLQLDFLGFAVELDDPETAHLAGASGLRLG